MPAAWELVVSWCGEPIRAELLQGKVRVDAGGPSPADVPLPLDGRVPLVREGRAGLALLGAAGATWSIDGAAVSGESIAFQEGVARLAAGNLEVALQRTTPAPRLPRFAPMGGTLLHAATFTAAYALIGLTLYTESPNECSCRIDLPADPPVSVATRSDVAPPPPRVQIPRWMALDSRDESARPERAPAPSSQPARADRRHAAPPPRADIPTVSPMEPMLELSAATLGHEIVRVDDLADEPVVRDAFGAAQGVSDEEGDGTRAARGLGRGRGGIGSCDGPHFAALVARHGRQTAIVACAPAPELGHAPTGRPGHNVVLHERDGSRLAPEVWTWSTSPAAPRMR